MGKAKRGNAPKLLDAYKVREFRQPESKLEFTSIHYQGNDAACQELLREIGKVLGVATTTAIHVPGELLTTEPTKPIALSEMESRIHQLLREAGEYPISQISGELGLSIADLRQCIAASRLLTIDDGDHVWFRL